MIQTLTLIVGCVHLLLLAVLLYLFGRVQRSLDTLQRSRSTAQPPAPTKGTGRRRLDTEIVDIVPAHRREQQEPQSWAEIQRHMREEPKAYGEPTAPTNVVPVPIMHGSSEEEKGAYLARLEAAQQRLGAPSQPPAAPRRLSSGATRLQTGAHSAASAPETEERPGVSGFAAVQAEQHRVRDIVHDLLSRPGKHTPTSKAPRDDPAFPDYSAGDDGRL